MRPRCSTPVRPRCCQQPQDLEGAAELLRMAVQSANPTGKVYPAGKLPAGPRDAVPGAAKIDKMAEKQKSCDVARQEQALLRGIRFRAARPDGRSIQQAVDKNLGIIKQYKPRVASMLKAYCKGK